MFAAVVGQSWATAAHPFSLEINGVDVIASAHMDSIRVEMAGPGTNGSLDVDIWDPTAAFSVTEWAEVRLIEHAATRPILFGGFVQSFSYESWAVTGRTIRVRCVGYGVLLDKKVVPAFRAEQFAIHRRLVSLISQFGGRITATASNSNNVPADETLSLPAYGNNWAVPLDAADPFSLSANQTLRSAIENTVTTGTLNMVATSTYSAVGAGYWVDSAAMLRAYPEVPPEWSDHGGTDALIWANQWDGGTVPGLTVDTSGTVAVTRVSYEREDSDRATSAYVVGGAAPGTGYVRLASLERAGDLEILVDDSLSVDAPTLLARGGSSVRATSAATANGALDIASTVPLDCWPGRNLRITWPGAGLSAADFRITSCTVRFTGSTSSREYTIGFGGNAPAPSAMRHLRRKQPPRSRFG